MENIFIIHQWGLEIGHVTLSGQLAVSLAWLPVVSEKNKHLKYTGRGNIPGSHLHKIMNGLQVIQVVIMHIHTKTEVQSSITTIHNLEIAKLKQEMTYCFKNE